MKFLIDRCAGRLLADWLRKQGHDVIESRELGPDPGDRALIAWAAKEARILITIDTDFGELIYVENLSHTGLVRLPDVPARERPLIMLRSILAPSVFLQSFTMDFPFLPSFIIGSH